MRTREYEVFLSEAEIAELGMYKNFLIEISTDSRANKRLRARLIIELPERKVTISESEYSKAIKESFGDAYYFESLKTLKEKLFGKE